MRLDTLALLTLLFSRCWSLSMAVPLLSAVTSPKHLIADKAYDADSLRNWLKTRRIKAVIPSTATRTVPYPLDRAVYRRRNLIERLFCRLYVIASSSNTIIQTRSSVIED